MKLRPWRHVVTPREDLRDGKPLDAAEFAVHLDKVRNGDALEVYTKPDQFFARTFLTKNMLELASQVVRRLNGVTTETSEIIRRRLFEWNLDAVNSDGKVLLDRDATITRNRPGGAGYRI